eukprot:gb/GEZN01007624.1/.p1 GENE.gb/GEZN01007624.1/~~gb/GEZN01007624.1/.p1  ORF type:complete len:470 (-),score=42.55 gb/GEZN01007624.1/:54-1463(-)
MRILFWVCHLCLLLSWFCAAALSPPPLLPLNLPPLPPPEHPRPPPRPSLTAPPLLHANCSAAMAWNAFAFELLRKLEQLDEGKLIRDVVRLQQQQSLWAKRELSFGKDLNVLYPFSGPDFLTAMAFFPFSAEYIMMGGEEVMNQDACQLSALLNNSGFLNKQHKMLEQTVLLHFFNSLGGQYSLRLLNIADGGMLPLLLLHILVADTQSVILGVEYLTSDLGVPAVRCTFRNRYGLLQRVVYLRVDLRLIGEQYARTQALNLFPFHERQAKDAPPFPFSEQVLPFLESHGPYNTMLKASLYLPIMPHFAPLALLLMNWSTTLIFAPSEFRVKYLLLGRSIVSQLINMNPLQANGTQVGVAEWVERVAQVTDRAQPPEWYMLLYGGFNSSVFVRQSISLANGWGEFNSVTFHHKKILNAVVEDEAAAIDFAFNSTVGRPLGFAFDYLNPDFLHAESVLIVARKSHPGDRK